MLNKVAFTLNPATDVARARKFYEETLGLQPGLTGGQGEMLWVEYDLPGGGCLAISNATGAQPAANAGATVAFQVDDLDASVADLKGKGVEFTTDVIPGPSCRMIVCLDSEGNSIVLHEGSSQKP